MHAADLPVPGQVDVALGVAVEGEGFALQVVGVVVGVAQSAEQDGEAAPVLVETCQDAARRCESGGAAASVEVGIEQLPFAITAVRGSGINERRRDRGVVAQEHGGESVGAAADIVRAMLSHAPLESCELLECTVLVDFVESGLGVHVVAHGVHRASVEPDPLKRLDVGGQHLFAIVDAVTVAVDQQDRMLVLTRGHRTALAVESERDDRSGKLRRERGLHREPGRSAEA